MIWFLVLMPFWLPPAFFGAVWLGLEIPGDRGEHDEP